jgi:hypothetical protein
VAEVTTWRRARRWLPVAPRLRSTIRQGIESGFPACCIAWYCTFAWLPDRVHDGRGFWNLLRVPNGRGYVPCPRHYRKPTPHEVAAP